MGGNATVFGVNFADGRIKGYPRDTGPSGPFREFRRYVRGNPAYGSNKFVDNGDGTLTDQATWLMWTVEDSGLGLNWSNALAWVEARNASNHLGHSDWRLPDAKELQSIVDYTRSPDTTHSSAIHPLFHCTPIVNEAGQPDWPYYWTGTTHAAAAGQGAWAAYVCFGRAMGYMNATWMDVHGAGAQRSDPKTGSASDYPTGHGPQGDSVRVTNFVRLVRTAPSRQNILLVIADDFGAESSALYNSTSAGASLPPTPNINSLAQSGVVFRQAYANPLCSPTRSCIMTGRHAFRTGVGDVITGPADPHLTLAEFTLPDAFAANSGLGYELAQFGKWHLGGSVNAPNLLGGWPHFAGSLAGALTDYTNWTKVVNGVQTAGYTNYATTDVVDDAITWIQGRGARPWFAWVAFNAGHTPYHLPPTNLCPHYASLPGTPDDINANPRPYFEAMIEAMDTEIGRLLSVVDRANTHIVFLGDNGSAGQVIQPPFTSTRAKATLYEGGIRVPLIIAGPAVVNPGRTNDTPAHAVDLYATILELAGIQVTSTVPAVTTMDSHSLLAAVQGRTEPSRRVYAELFNTNAPAANDGCMLRNAQFKLLRFERGTEEFYDLAADPTERTNLLTGTLTATQLANYYSLTLAYGGYQDDYAQPAIVGQSRTPNRFDLTVHRDASLTCQLWRAAELSELAWEPVTNALAVTNSPTNITLTDPDAPGPAHFYRVLGTAP